MHNLCDSCLNLKDGCIYARDKTTKCQWFLNEQMKIDRERSRRDVAAIISTPEGARECIREINEYVFNPEPFTGNSETHYKLGERGAVMKKLKLLLDIYDLDEYTDLVVYLHKITKGDRTNARRE